VSSVVSEAGAVRHAHAGQGPRSNSPSAEPADQASPFAALLDGTSDTSLATGSAPTTATAAPAPPPQLPSQKPGLRPQDGRTTQSPTETAPSPQKSPSENPAAAGQGGAASPPSSSAPSTSPQGGDIAQSVLALGLVKAALKDTKATVGANVDSTATGNATNATAGTTATDAGAAGSTAAAVTDIHGGDKTTKSDVGASDTTSPAPADAPANQANAAPAQTVVVAVAIATTVIAVATIDNGGASGSGNGTGPDAAQIAALGDAVKAGTPSRKAGADAAASGSAPDPGGGGKPTAPNIADAAKLIPALTPLPGQKDLNSPAGQGQPNAATDGSQSGNAVATTQAAIDRARQHAATGQPADASAGSQPGQSNGPNDNSNVGPNADPTRDPAASANRIEDITRQALGAAVRHGEAQTAEFSAGGGARADGVQSGGVQPSPDGRLVVPAALTTAAAPAAAPNTNASPTAIPLAGLAVEIAAHARAGNNRFDIRLDPPELGRIDVRLDVDRDGKVTSRLVVDRPQTLDMLRRDAPELERSLQQAGLKTSDNALQFSLRDQGGFAGQNPYSNNGSPANSARVIIPDRDMAPIDTAAAGYGRALGASTGLDIRV
jgi:flagellar hook-length control protein FliK